MPMFKFRIRNLNVLFVSVTKFSTSERNQLKSHSNLPNKLSNYLLSKLKALNMRLKQGKTRFKQSRNS